MTAAQIAKEIALRPGEWEEYRSGQRIAQQSVIDRISTHLPEAQAVFAHGLWRALNPGDSWLATKQAIVHFQEIVDMQLLRRSLEDRTLRRRLTLRHPLDGLALAVLQTRSNQRQGDEAEAFLWARISMQELLILALREECRTAYICVWDALKFGVLANVSDGQFRIATKQNCIEDLVSSLWDRLTELVRLASGGFDRTDSSYFADSTLADFYSKFIVLALTPGSKSAEELQGLLQATHARGFSRDDYASIATYPLLQEIGP